MTSSTYGCPGHPMSGTATPPSHVITGLVPVISIVGGAALVRIGMAGTRPAMTWEGGIGEERRQRYVLTLFLTIVPTWAIPLRKICS